MMILQMVATWLALAPLVELKVLPFKRYNYAQAKQFFWISVLYSANTSFALLGLKSLNVPMYNVIKRLTPMVVMSFKVRPWSRAGGVHAPWRPLLTHTNEPTHEHACNAHTGL